MDNQWLTLDEAATLSGKSPSMLRKLSYKKKIIWKILNNKLAIDYQSLVDFYKLTIEENNIQDNQTGNHGYDSDNNVGNNELANRYDELKTIHSNMKEQLTNEKLELADKLIDIKKQHLEDFTRFDDIVVQKNKTIEKKAQLAGIYLVLFLFTVALLVLLVIFYFLQKT